MKKNITLKLLTILFALTLVFAISTFFVGNKENKVIAEKEESTLSIDYVDLSLEDNVYIKFAVNTNDANTTLLVWTTPQTNYTFDGYIKGTENFELSNATQETINEKVYMIFTYTQLSAKQMTDEIYVRAYNNGSYSNVVKYSILQYAYETVLEEYLKEEPNNDKISLLYNMINYGATAQTYFNYKPERLATAPFYQVNVIGGVLLDGTTKGLYQSGEKINVSAPATNSEGEIFLRWINSSSKTLSKDLETTITVEDDDVFIAVYGKEGDISEEEMFAYYLTAINNFTPDYSQDFAVTLIGNNSKEYTENKTTIQNQAWESNYKYVLSFEKETGKIYYIELFSYPEENESVNNFEYVLPSNEKTFFYSAIGIKGWSFVTEEFVPQVYERNIDSVMNYVFDDILGENVESIGDLMAKEYVSNVSIINNNDNTFTLTFDYSNSGEWDNFFYDSGETELFLPCSFENITSYEITFDENQLLSISVDDECNYFATKDENTYGNKDLDSYTITFSDSYDSETIESIGVQIPTGEELEGVEFLQTEVSIDLMYLDKKAMFIEDFGHELTIDEIVEKFKTDEQVVFPENCRLELYYHDDNDELHLIESQSYKMIKYQADLVAKIVPNEGYAFVSIEYLMSLKNKSYFGWNRKLETIKIDAEKEPYIYSIPTDLNSLKTIIDVDANYDPACPENYKVTVNGSDFDITENSQIELSAGNSYYIKITMIEEKAK